MLIKLTEESRKKTCGAITKNMSSLFCQYSEMCFVWTLLCACENYTGCSSVHIMRTRQFAESMRTYNKYITLANCQLPKLNQLGKLINERQCLWWCNDTYISVCRRLFTFSISCMNGINSKKFWQIKIPGKMPNVSVGICRSRLGN